MKRPILRHVAYLTASKYVSEGLFLVRGLVVASVLGPVAFGVWTAMRLMIVFSSFAHLGSRAGMTQSAPEAEGGGDFLRADEDRRVASAVMMIGAMGLAAIVAVVFGGFAPTGDPRWWWWTLAGVLILQQLHMFYRVSLASQRRFGWTSAAATGFAALSTVTGTFGAIYFGLGGFLLALAGSHIVVLLVCVTLGPSFPRPRFERQHAIELIRIGWPITIGQVLLILLWNVDKLALWIWRGSADLGVYSVQAYFTATIMLLPSAVAVVLHPHLRLRIGATRDATSVQPFLNRGTEVLALAAVPVLGLAYCLLHLPVRWLLPDYEATVAPGRVLVLVSFFSIIATVPTAVIVALSHQRRLLLIRLISVVVSIVAAALALAMGGGYIAVAMAVSAGFAVHAMLSLITALRKAHVTKAAAWRHVAFLAGPAATLLFLVALVDVVIPDTRADWQSDVMCTAVRCAIMLAVTGPLTLIGLRRFGLLTEFKTPSVTA